MSTDKICEGGMSSGAHYTLATWADFLCFTIYSVFAGLEVDTKRLFKQSTVGYGKPWRLIINIYWLFFKT